MTTWRFSSAAVAMLLLLTACGANSARKTAAADLKDGKGQNVGVAKLQSIEGGVEMSVEAMNLSPGVHAIHIHEAGKCDAPDFKTAGGHFNPASRKHGLQNPEGHHAGDLPNLTVDPNGRGVFSGTAHGVTLAGDGPTSLFRAGGTSVVIHETADDMMTDPAGNAGARIACGVIQ